VINRKQKVYFHKPKETRVEVGREGTFGRISRYNSEQQRKGKVCAAALDFSASVCPNDQNGIQA